MLSSRHGWSTVLASSSSPKLKAVVLGIGFAGIATSAVAITMLHSLQRPASGRDCPGQFVYSRSTFVRDTAFTAHVILVGHQAKLSNGWIGSWALVRVQEHLAGWRPPRLIFLTRGAFRSGEDYFIDGRRPRGVLTRILPLVEVDCSPRSDFLSDAGVSLRLLKSGFPKNDVRIIGRVDRWLKATSQPYAQHERLLVRGAQVVVSGPGGVIVATTDEEGVYDVPGLPPGTYNAHLQSGGSSQDAHALSNGSCDLKPGEVAIYSFSFR